MFAVPGFRLRAVVCAEHAAQIAQAWERLTATARHQWRGTVADALLEMVNLDIAVLEKAYRS